MSRLQAVSGAAHRLPAAVLDVQEISQACAMSVAQAFAWSLQLPLLAIVPAHEAHHANALVPTDAERQLAVEGAVEGTAAAAASPLAEDGLTTPLLQSPALEDGEAEKI